MRVPETDRRARHVVRTRLAWAGFGSLGPGLWISPHVAREQEAMRVLREAGVAEDAHVFVARRTGLSDTRDMVAAAWDLPEIEAEYEQFVTEFRVPGVPADVLLRQLELVHAWRRFPALDPALPRSCCRPGGRAPGRRSCSSTGTSGGRTTRAASGSGSIAQD